MHKTVSLVITYPQRANIITFYLKEIEMHEYRHSQNKRNFIRNKKKSSKTAAQVRLNDIYKNNIREHLLIFQQKYIVCTIHY